MIRLSAIIVCAGSSVRYGTDKQLELIGGIPVFIHSIRAFSGIADEIIVVISENKKDIYINLITEFGLSVKLAYGGNTRQKSVFSGLEQVSEESQYIAIHDGARPLIKKKDILKVIGDAEKYKAAALAVPIKDTIKRVENSYVVDTPNREILFAMQTPQVFLKRLYKESLENVGDSDFTDDCALIENYGKEVRITMGDYTNIKITNPEDLAIAKVFYGF